MLSLVKSYYKLWMYDKRFIYILYIIFVVGYWLDDLLSFVLKSLSCWYLIGVWFKIILLRF